MPSPIRGSTLHHRELLSTGWDFCAVAPDAVASPAELNEGLNWLKATAPCTAASALRELGQWSFDAPARRFDADDWWFRCVFASQADQDRVVLGFDGLATLAEAWLNGEKILSSENMFIAHEVDITDRLKATNSLCLRFRSLDKALAAKRPRPRWKAPMIENQQLRWFRTTVLGRTPGWSPSAAAVGPWRAVWIEYRNDIAIDDLKLRTSVDGTAGNVLLDLKHSSISDAKLVSAELIVAKEGQRFSQPLALTDSNAHCKLTIPNAERWWPHTHGNPTLYSAQLALKIEDASKRAASHTVDLGPVGFRTVRVDTTDDHFRVIVNDIPIFCRGACWTPIDVVTLRASDRDYGKAVEQVRDAGMNMIRIGGTMVYEDDALLSACDREGVLIWQDLMFANMDFPHGDTQFDASVERELGQQLPRLASHPSVALICGNSEVEQQAAMFGATRDRWTQPVFHQVILRLAGELIPDAPYWPSSAHGGSFPHQPNIGTTSYYGVGAYLRGLADARTSEVKFASECLAFANIPEDSTIEKMPKGLGLRVHHPEWKARTPRDLGAGWDFEDVRDHYVKEMFGVDVASLRYSDHDRYLQLGRIATAEVIAATFAEWRRKRSVCGGGLVWFLRDLIPGAGWGVLDALGQPKSAYYAMKRVLQPVAVFISDEGCNGLAIHVVNESAERCTATLKLTLLRNGHVLVTEGTREIVLEPHSNVELAANELFEGFYDLSFAYRFGPPAFDVAAATLKIAEEVVSTAVHSPAPAATLNKCDAGISAVLEPEGEAFKLVLNTQRLARFVSVHVDGFMSDDQYFDLIPGTERIVRLRAKMMNAAPALRGVVSAVNGFAPVQIEMRA